MKTTETRVYVLKEEAQSREEANTGLIDGPKKETEEWRETKKEGN